MIRATIKVIPWRETHVIQTRNYDRLQKIIMVFLAAQCSKLKKKLVLTLCNIQEKISVKKPFYLLSSGHHLYEETHSDVCPRKLLFFTTILFVYN